MQTYNNLHLLCPIYAVIGFVTEDLCLQ